MSNIDRSMPFFARYRNTTKRSDQPINLAQAAFKIQLTRTRNGTTMKDWREKIVNLENATTGMTGIYDTCDSRPLTGTWKYVQPGGGLFRDIHVYGDYPLANGLWTPPVINPSMDIEEALNGALAKFYSMLRSEVQLISGPTALGELRETLRMLRRPLSALHSEAHGYLDLLEKWKKRNYPKVSPSDAKGWERYSKDLTKAASGAWLEQSFGWAPLINDCKGAMKALARLNKPRAGRVFSVGYKANQSSPQALQSPFNNGAGNNVNGVEVQFRYYGKVIDTVSIRFKGRLKAQVDQVPFDNWKLFGFQSNEFLPTAWELLPWSFLADYFSNIGNVLESYATATDNVEVAWTARTIVQKAIFHGVTVEDVVGTDARNTGFKRQFGLVTGGTCNTTRKVVSRGTLAGLPPFPRFQLNFKLGAGQLGNIAALLGQSSALHGQRTTRNWHR